MIDKSPAVQGSHESEPSSSSRLDERTEGRTDVVMIIYTTATKHLFLRVLMVMSK